MCAVKILALDYGSKNIGLALSDELAMIVRPLPSVPNRSRSDLLCRLREVVRDQEVGSLVLGLPLNMDGSCGEAVLRVRQFEQRLRQEFDLPVSEMDERLSTEEALEMWRTMKARQQQRYRTVDSLAAALILQRFLRES